METMVVADEIVGPRLYILIALVMIGRLALGALALSALAFFGMIAAAILLDAVDRAIFGWSERRREMAVDGLRPHEPVQLRRSVRMILSNRRQNAEGQIPIRSPAFDRVPRPPAPVAGHVDHSFREFPPVPEHVVRPDGGEAGRPEIGPHAY